MNLCWCDPVCLFLLFAADQASVLEHTALGSGQELLTQLIVLCRFITTRYSF